MQNGTFSNLNSVFMLWHSSWILTQNDKVCVADGVRLNDLGFLLYVLLYVEKQL